MFEKEQILTKYININKFQEDQEYQRDLLNITMFPSINVMNKLKFFKGTLNFSLKEVGFNKKKALVFFLAIELLTNQKCIATLSSKNVLTWKLRKGALVGCKVTLRKKNLSEFFDTISIAVPRMENFKMLSLAKSKRLKGSNNDANTFSFALNELVMFHPIELGLGINTEVRKADFQLSFSTYNRSEQIFLLTNSKIPLNNAPK
jgi:large subunit ribosomal protein L5